MDSTEMEKRIGQLEKSLFDLSQQVYLNNFSAYQDFNKKCNFNTGIKIPHYTYFPPKSEVGELIEVSGKLYICSQDNTWQLVGTQT